MAKIILINTGQQEELLDGSSLKEVCDNKFRIPFGCEDGICGTCRIKITDGKENLTPKNQKEEDMFPGESDVRLACQCKINKGLIKIDY
ncbi:MAG: 2Fe-2S iron-sulfur cluster-binding protein [Nanoarchaeota archaeon]